MAKIDWKEARKATVAAEQKKAANEEATRLGTTLEAIQQLQSKAEPVKETKKSRNKGGRPTTATEDTMTKNFRITEEQSRKIDEWVYLKKGTDRSDVVRKALDLMFGE